MHIISVAWIIYKARNEDLNPIDDNFLTDEMLVNAEGITGYHINDRALKYSTFSRYTECISKM